MKKLAIALMAGMLVLGVGERVAEDGLVIQKSLADDLKPTPEQCQVLSDAGNKLLQVLDAVTEADDCNPCLSDATHAIGAYYAANCL